MAIRCNVCQELRHFRDRHSRPDDEQTPTGPPCRVCGERLEYRCVTCDHPWSPLS